MLHVLYDINGKVTTWVPWRYHRVQSCNNMENTCDTDRPETLVSWLVFLSSLSFLEMLGIKPGI